MLFPIGDDNIERGYPAVFSYGFLVLHTAVFLFQASFPTEYEQRAFVTAYGCVPADISNGLHLQTLVSSIFLHGSWLHLLGNMLYLWIFADNIEATVGSFRFVLFYLTGGLVSGLAQVMIDPYSLVPCIGASGAIAAVMGAYIVMFPHSRVKMLFLLFFIVFYVPSWVFLGLWFVQQAVSGTSADGLADVSGVAWWAHIGGFVFGLGLGWYFRGRFVSSHPE